MYALPRWAQAVTVSTRFSGECIIYGKPSPAGDLDDAQIAAMRVAGGTLVPSWGGTYSSGDNPCMTLFAPEYPMKR